MNAGIRATQGIKGPAMKREYEIKHLSRAEKLRLVKNFRKNVFYG